MDVAMALDAARLDALGAQLEDDARQATEAMAVHAMTVAHGNEGHGGKGGSGGGGEGQPLVQPPVAASSAAPQRRVTFAPLPGDADADGQDAEGSADTAPIVGSLSAPSAGASASDIDGRSGTGNDADAALLAALTATASAGSAGAAIGKPRGFQIRVGGRE